MRITRILQCLADFELENLQIGWIEFLIEEIFLNQKLNGLEKSMTDYWVHTVRADEKRESLIKAIEKILTNDGHSRSASSSSDETSDITSKKEDF